MDAPETLAQRVKRLRQHKGLTVPLLASRADVGERVIQRIESGETTDPQFETAFRLARALGVGLYHFAFGESAAARDLMDLVYDDLAKVKDAVDALDARVSALESKR